ncbi:MAG: hypothetical protein ILA34_01240 [Bacteroidaceae bacterium]|nr:hypothetical protein [Bacteroidaceae bacterium]
MGTVLFATSEKTAAPYPTARFLRPSHPMGSPTGQEEAEATSTMEQ